jgi:large subunit ribosomal protein L34
MRWLRAGAALRSRALLPVHRAVAGARPCASGAQPPARRAAPVMALHPMRDHRWFQAAEAPPEVTLDVVPPAGIGGLLGTRTPPPPPRRARSTSPPPPGPAGIALELSAPPAPAVELPPASLVEEIVAKGTKGWRTYQPNRLKRKRTHGFLRRAPPRSSTPPRPPTAPATTVERTFPPSPRRRRPKTPAGRRIIARRRAKGRWKVAVT